MGQGNSSACVGYAQSVSLSLYGSDHRHAKRLVDLAARSRIPAIYGSPEFVEAGGLVSYSGDFADNYRRAAGYVEKILKGARPEDLPVEQVQKLEFVLNQKTASALGLTVPHSLLLRVTRVID